MLKIESQEVRSAYNRLKSHIYYDTGDLFIRRRLAEFETNLSAEHDIFSVNKEYLRKDKLSIFSGFGLSKTLDEKFEKIADALNGNDGEFFNAFLKKITVRYLPKTFEQEKLPLNFISNRRERQKYNIERASAFIDIPIELHLVTVLWIMKYGKELDSQLSDDAYGNRLLLNKERNDLIKGSGLFKPYYKQYQKWRDKAVKTSKEALENNEDVLFLNLDIKDYYYSVNIDLNSLIEPKRRYYPTLLEVFNEIHIQYTQKLKECKFPFDLNKNLKNKEVILPIGLLSSYILGNYFLKDLDTKINKRVKPLYYGRYVDDILIVIKNPICIVDINEKTQYELIASELENIFCEEKEPVDEENPCKEIKSKLRLKDKKYKNLYCQSDKTLLYFFDHEESELVIDKLKRELDERASEFRDFPAEDDNKTFEDSAYHLLYDGSEGKIKTLKDYKENRFGLSVFLSNKIFSALRHKKKLRIEESRKILKYFKGLNCLESFRQWEKIFTFFMVNGDSESLVDFYIHSFEQIGKIQNKFLNDEISIEERSIETSLQEYLDCAFEMVLALNPMFVSKNNVAIKKLEFFQNEHNDWYSYIVRPFGEPTNPKSYYIERFRLSNLVRHHYVVQPLINYTKIVKDKKHNLTGLDLPIKFGNKPLTFNEISIKNSPRPVKFWECCLAVINIQLASRQLELSDEKDDLKLNLFSLFKEVNEEGEVVNTSFYLDEAFDLYKRINEIHLPEHLLTYGDFKKDFYRYSYDKQNTQCDLIEFQVNKEDRLKNIRFSFANTEVKLENIEYSIRGIPQINSSRYNTFQKIFKYTREENADILLLPENVLPYQLLSSLARFSCDNSIMSISGLEHWKIKNYVFNFIVTVLPITVNNIKDAVVLIRLKNHYAPSEKELIRSEHLFCPKPQKYRYDLINWRNLYFSPFYCFELADSMHRSLFKSKVDLLVASEWNKDTPYYSNIVEALSRDIHAYIAQVNTSQYGDSRLTKPSSSATKDILKLKGGVNDTVLIGEITLDSLRRFQRKNYNQTKDNKEFKPLPPDYDYKNAIKRENNKNILDDDE